VQALEGEKKINDVGREGQGKEATRDVCAALHSQESKEETVFEDRRGVKRQDEAVSA
jgi:hypothetical protein